MKYGAKDPVFGQPEYAHFSLAVLGIVMSFFKSLSLLKSVWQQDVCIPIAGYNIGVKKKERAKALFSLYGGPIESFLKPMSIYHINYLYVVNFNFLLMQAMDFILYQNA